MRSFVFTLIVFLSLFFTGGLFAAQPCGFSGTFQGKKTRSVKCEIARAGQNPYLLGQILHKGKVYLIDLSPLPSARSGKKKFNVRVVAHPRPRVQVFYNGKVRTKLIASRKNPNVRGIKVAMTVRSKKGKKIKLAGFFMWDTAKMKTGKVYRGSISFKLGSKKIGPRKTSLKPWNSGLRLLSTMTLSPGETLTIMIQLPAAKNGNYRSGQKPTDLRLTYIKMVNGKMKMDMYTKNDVSIKVKVKGKRIRLKFKGMLKAKTGNKRISGEFEGSL